MRVRVRKAVESAVENSLLMVLGAIIALIWAKTAPRDAKATFASLPFAVSAVWLTRSTRCWSE